MVNNNWWQLSIKINRDLEEIIIWKLNSICINTYSFSYRTKEDIYRDLNIWLPCSNWDKSDRDNLEKIFSKYLSHNGLQREKYNWKYIREENWLESWKKFWGLSLIGNNWLILPCWMKLPKQYTNKTVIKIDPGAAFGTGGHPSTSLCLEAMENLVLNNKVILDIGSGSGILTIASKLLGASMVHAIDSDYLAVKSTKENFKLNFSNFLGFEISEGSFLDIKDKYSPGCFDLIICNILANVIKTFIPYFREILAINGKLILSGILLTQKEEIIETLNVYKFKIEKIYSKDDWVSLILSSS